MYWNNSGLSFRFTISGVLQCPGREIVWSAMKEVLLSSQNGFSGFLAAGSLEWGRKQVLSLKSHFRTRQMCLACKSCNVVHWWQNEVLALLCLIDIFTVALSTVSEGHLPSLQTPEYLKDFCLYVFNLPLYPFIQLTCNIWVYKSFQNWASGT